MMAHPFKIGENYSNNNGAYQVVSIEDSNMLIRYEDGQEQNVDLAIQTRIWRRVKREIERAEKERKSQKGRKGSTRGRKRKKSLSAAEQEQLIAEILQDDGAIFEILTRLVIPPGQINTYRFFVQNPDDYFSMDDLAAATRDSDQESLQGVLMAFGNRISSSPDTRIQKIRPYNSLFFKRKKSSGKTLYKIRKPVIEIFQSYPTFYDFLINDNRSWLPDAFGSPTWTNTPQVHKMQMQHFDLWDRYSAGK